MDEARRTTLKTLAGATASATSAGSRPPGALGAEAQDADTDLAWLQPYDPVWTTQSRNSSESMPCGGGDIGLNVWVEDDQLLFYINRSGAFDETNSYLKLGRVRLDFGSQPPSPPRPFRQHLRLADGEMSVRIGDVAVLLWADVERPIVHIAVESPAPVSLTATLESWRTRDRDYLPAEMSMHRSYDGAPVTPRQYADDIAFAEGGVLSVHRNRDEDTVFDLLVAQQGLDAVKGELWNPLRGLTFGVLMRGEALAPAGQSQGRYASSDFTGWRLASVAPKPRHTLQLLCHIDTTPSLEAWRAGLKRLSASAPGAAASRARSRRWWRDYWSRSHIVIEPGPARPDSQPWRIGRNYQLFRHQLGTNARAAWPTKFNGGNFTFDPQYVDPAKTLSPDFRAWGGGTFTAQNQRLVHWPMLKSGDVDLMQPQFDFYRRIRRNAELRSQTYWGHGGACFVEQIENFGLCCGQEWGWKRTWDKPSARLPGVEDSAFTSYLWDTVLEVCLMMLEAHRFSGADLTPDLVFIDSCVRFFDEHYRQEYRKISGADLDGAGKLVIFPGTACETYKTALNSTVTIAGLDAVLSALLALPAGELQPEARARYEALHAALPPFAGRTLAGRRVIAPAALWDRIQNVEIPQLYPVFPYGQYGLGRPDLQRAIDTWRFGVDTPEQKNIISWHQDAIFCARLGLTDEAARLTAEKMDDAPRRYPTFWGPGHDWAPDHNWGGSGMVGLQEMLLQTPGDALLLFPAWPREWNVRFRLHAPRSTVIEAELKDGRLLRLDVEPTTMRGRLVLPAGLTDPI